MTRETEAIDWSAPIEAYHPDGRVVALERAYGWCIRKHLSVDDARNWSFREDGTHGNSEWRIRNRKPAQQWGDPIEVNGERPVWLGDDDAIRYQNVVQEGDHWVTPPAGSVGRWGGSKWHRIQRIRLAADHWAYEALSRGMVPEGVTALDPELVDRMVEVVREFAGDDYGHNFGPVWSDVRAIAAELPPEPVDPVVARAREIVAGEVGCPIETVVDDLPMMRATIRALREGMGDD